MPEVAANHGFRFDAVLMPSNLMDAHFRSFVQSVMPKLVGQKIGIQTMKPFCGGKPEILEQAFEAARTFQRMDDQEFAQLIGKTQQIAATGEYELFKVSAHFDGTARHPDWLGGDDPAVQKLAPQRAG